jgi:hypothetical protein
MKIIFVPKETVEWVWDRLQPQQRFLGELGSRSLKLPWEETILVPIDAQLQFGRFDNVLKEITVKEFRELISNGEYQKLELKPVRSLAVVERVSESKEEGSDAKQ